MIQDADLECNPQDYGALMEPLAREEADVVFGSRYLTRQNARCNWRFSRIGVDRAKRVRRLLYGVRLTDEATCFKVFPTAVLREMELECEQFKFCPEVTAKACRLGLASLKSRSVITHERSRRAEDPVDGRMEGTLDLVEISQVAHTSWPGARVCNAPLRDVMGRWLDVGYRTGIIF